MPRIPTRRVQPFVCLITTFVLALLFASCDQAGLAPTPEAPAGVSPETLTFTPMPNGATLLEPGDAPAAKQSGASPYGCYLASRPYTDEVRFRSVYLHFPEDIVEAADGETEPFIRRVAASPDGSVPGEKDIRYMNCVIPRTPEAEELVTEQLLRAGMYEAAEAALQETNQSSAKDDAPCYVFVTIHVTCVGSVDDPYQNCTIDSVEEQQMCGGSTGGDATEVNIEWPDGSGGGSSSGGGSGSGSCMEINPPPGSDCAQDQESTETKLFKMAGRLIELIEDGGDLLKISTWKKLGQEQWADVVGCAASISSATTTLNAWSLIEVMDCAASIYFGISGGNILSAFKTVGLFDDMIEIVAQSNRSAYIQA